MISKFTLSQLRQLYSYDPDGVYKQCSEIANRLSSETVRVIPFSFCIKPDSPPLSARFLVEMTGSYNDYRTLLNGCEQILSTQCYDGFNDDDLQGIFFEIITNSMYLKCDSDSPVRILNIEHIRNHGTPTKDSTLLPYIKTNGPRDSFSEAEDGYQEFTKLNEDLKLIQKGFLSIEELKRNLTLMCQSYKGDTYDFIDTANVDVKRLQYLQKYKEIRSQRKKDKRNINNLLQGYSDSIGLPFLHILATGNIPSNPILLDNAQLTIIPILRDFIFYECDVLTNWNIYHVECSVSGEDLKHALKMSVGSLMIIHANTNTELQNFLAAHENIILREASRVQLVFRLEELEIDSKVSEATRADMRAAAYAKAVDTLEAAGLRPATYSMVKDDRYHSDEFLINFLAQYGIAPENRLAEEVKRFRASSFTRITDYVKDALNRRIDTSVKLLKLNNTPLSPTREGAIDLLADIFAVSPNGYNPMINWLDPKATGLLEQRDFTRSALKIVATAAEMDKLGHTQSARHIVICGNTGTGKLSFAKILANILREAGLVHKDCQIAAASAFISEFQGQSSNRVRQFFDSSAGSAIILYGLETLLNQCDYGQQVLDEIGNQMRNTPAGTIVILLGDKESILKVRSKRPSIDRAINTVINLDDYNRNEIEEMLLLKLTSYGFHFDGSDLISDDIQNAVESLMEEYQNDKTTLSAELKFNMTTSCCLDDVQGNEIAKSELKMLASRIAKGALVPPKGILLYGAPGTGKTMLAKAFAHDAGIPFCNVPSSYFNDAKGDGSDKVHKLFVEARKRGRCILFIDEIEAIAPSRDITSLSSPVLVQLLQEIDGFESSGEITIIAASNYPGKIDAALLRSGRFDYKFRLEMPNTHERESLFEFYIKQKLEDSFHTGGRTYLYPNSVREAISTGMNDYMKCVAGIESDVDSHVNIGVLLGNGHFVEKLATSIFEQYSLRVQDVEYPDQKQCNTTNTRVRVQISPTEVKKFAELTPGVSGATVKAIVERACNLAMDTQLLLASHIFAAIRDITEGSESNVILKEDEIERTAFHEVGHAMVALLMSAGSDLRVRKVSIIPRESDCGIALGITSINPESTRTNSGMLTEICVAFAGRIAEEIIYGKKNISTGCIEDMRCATKTAREYIVSYGFDEEKSLLCGDYEKMSDKTKAAIDARTEHLLNDCLKETRELLSKHRIALHDITTELVKKQELSGEEVLAMLKV